MRKLSIIAAIVTIGVLHNVTSLVAQTEQQEYRPNDLWTAAKEGDLEAVTAILDSGIEVDAKTKYNATALSYAAERGHLEIVKLLVERGADVNNKDTFYNATPLLWASSGQHKEVIEFLKEKGGKSSFGRVSSDDSKDKKESDEKKKDEAGTEENKKSSEADKSDGGKNETKSDSAAESEEAPKFETSSAESRLEDRKYVSINWPQFRGTGARGVADGQGPPTEFDIEADENVLWKVELPGLGHSCPSIWGDKIFLTSAISGAEKESIQIGNYGSVDSVDDESVHKFIVFCVNKNTGEIEWQQTAIEAVPKVKRHLKSTHANPTVACNDERLVAFFGSEGLYCYDHDGELIWKKELGFLDSGWFYDADYQWGFAASPVIFENSVIVQCDIQENSFIAAYSLDDGAELWKTPREEIPGWSSPTIYRSGDRTLVATCGSKGLRGYDARTGEEVWTFAAPNSEIVTPTPFVSQGKIFFTAGYSPIMPIYAISVEANGTIEQQSESDSQFVEWSHRRGGPYMPSPIAYGDYFYTCSNLGVVGCYHIPTGKRVYQKRLKGGKNERGRTKSLSYVASPVAADGYIFLPSENGQIVVIKSGPEFEQVGVSQTDMKILSSPAISEGRLYLRGQKYLLAVGEK